jgi:hypothetical protein
MDWRDNFVSIAAKMRLANMQYPDLTGFFPTGVSMGDGKWQYENAKKTYEDYVANLPKKREWEAKYFPPTEEGRARLEERLQKDVEQYRSKMEHAKWRWEQEQQYQYVPSGEMVSLEEYMDQVREAFEGRTCEEGETFYRIVREQSQTLECHPISGGAVNLMGAHYGNLKLPVPLYCIHVTNDVDYWANRLSHDLDLDQQSAAVADIFTVPGDFVCEDFQYMMDPSGHMKADSWILVTSRAQLTEGQDFTYDERLTREVRTMEIQDEDPDGMW